MNAYVLEANRNRAPGITKPNRKIEDNLILTQTTRIIYVALGELWSDFCLYGYCFLDYEMTIIGLV